MDLDWNTLLSAVLGAAVGGGLAILASWLQSRQATEHRREEFDAEVAARRADVAWDRGYEHAQSIVRSLTDLRRTLVNPNVVSVMLMPAHNTARERVRETISEMRSETLYLPDPTRGQVQISIDVLLSLESCTTTTAWTAFGPVRPGAR